MMRSFFDTELCGAFTWNDIVPLSGEPAPRGAHNRRNPTGEYREIAGISFGDYELVVKSPEEHPPLGEVVLTYPAGDVERGPIDAVLWKRLGTIICRRELTRIEGHGERTQNYPG